MISGYKTRPYTEHVGRICFQSYLTGKSVPEAKRIILETPDGKRFLGNHVSDATIRRYAYEYVLNNHEACRPILDEERVGYGHDPFTDDEYTLFLVKHACVIWKGSAKRFSEWVAKLGISEEYLQSGDFVVPKGHRPHVKIAAK